MRRCRMAILASTVLLFTSTCGLQNDGTAVQCSGAASKVYAATTGSDVESTEEQAVPETLNQDYALLDENDAETYDVTEWWKANISDYDQSLSLIKYEVADSEPDPITTTTAVTTDTTEAETTTTTTTVETTVETTVSEIENVETTAPSLEEPAIRTTTTVDAPANSVVFYTYGFGHGVGMSQNGANFYARYSGYSYDQILALYYPGTTLVQTNVDPKSYFKIGSTQGELVNVIAQVINREMGPSMHTEALKAQAVAIYSFMLYNGYGNGLTGKPNPDKKIVDAVKSVVGQVLYYDGKPANTLFYASSGGSTASCKDIFVADIPYLRSVDVFYDDTCDPHYCDTKVFTWSQLKNKLQNAYHVSLSGTPSDWIQLTYGDGGYVAYATIGGKVTVKGNELRSVLGLKSPKFEFSF